MFVPLPTDVSSEESEDTEEENIYDVKRTLKKQEHQRKVLEAITLGREDATKDEVNLDQEGKFPYGSRCYR